MAKGDCKMIHRLRKAMRLSQDQFGALFGVHGATVRDWEKGTEPKLYCVELARLVASVNDLQAVGAEVKVRLACEGQLRALYFLLKLAFEPQEKAA